MRRSVTIQGRRKAVFAAAPFTVRTDGIGGGRQRVTPPTEPLRASRTPAARASVSAKRRSGVRSRPGCPSEGSGAHGTGGAGTSRRPGPRGRRRPRRPGRWFSTRARAPSEGGRRRPRGSSSQRARSAAAPATPPGSVLQDRALKPARLREFDAKARQRRGRDTRGPRVANRLPALKRSPGRGRCGSLSGLALPKPSDDL